MWWVAHKAAGTRFCVFLCVVLLVIAGMGPGPRVAAAELTDRSIKISNTDAAEDSVAYGVTFSTATTGMLGSILIQFCSNSSIVVDVCDAPDGFSAAGAALAGQHGATGFSLASGGAANELLLTRPPSMQAPIDASYDFTGVTNPFTGGSYFARILTYPTSDATGAFTDAGGLALYYRPSLGISAEVPPFLKFCVGQTIEDFDCTTATEPYSDLGVLAPKATSLAQSQALVATNAGGGYSMWVLGTTMTSGNNVLSAMQDEESRAGTSQFGINLRANTDPIVGADPTGPGVAAIAANYNKPNLFRFASGDTLATTTAPDDFRKYTISYIVNVANNQPGGVYSTTLTYITLANF